MKAVRYSNWYAKSDWEADPWCMDETHKSFKWNEGDNIDFVANGNYVVAGEGYCFAGYAYIHGKSAESGWNWDTLATLSNVKLNSSKHIEYYLTKTYTQWEEFGIKLFSDTWVAYDKTTFSDFVDKTEWKSEGGNIQYIGETAKQFALYFDRNAGTIYINDAIHAAADDWSSSFLNGVGCDPTGVNEPANWSTYAGTYAKLHDDVKDLIYAAEAKVDGTLTEHAVATYDYAVAHHSGLEKFIKDRNGTARLFDMSTLSVVPTVANNNSATMITLVAVITLASVSAIVLFVVIKKRKHN